MDIALLLKNFGGLNQDYLDNIKSVLDSSLAEHSRTLVLRFDLHLPFVTDGCPFLGRDILLNEARTDSKVITRFIESLKARIRYDLIRRRREGKRVHPTSLRYVRVTEVGKSGRPHFHFAIFLNADSYYMGHSNYKSDNGIIGMLRKAWKSALNLPIEECRSLVYIPDNPFYVINRNAPGSLFKDKYEEALYRLSYLAKFDTKVSMPGWRNFSCSQR
ncbi:MAG: inovirus Gp2 family protein [Pseudomonadota bacterium]|uniref:inovirus Gp2 family protein n=1 Tax=Gallaecimonas pentaromativorans TaxID=584787 RepID=UPI0009FAD74B|nr:inovirus Gp2 family protein [Gallaecimonas pentaromativorans]MED5525613.1 inovirus Gp2 family protein [Pseudomonadota bacterium]